MPLSLRLVAILGLVASMAAGLTCLAFLALAELAAHQGSASRQAGRSLRIRTAFGPAAGPPAALDAAVAALARRGTLAGLPHLVVAGTGYQRGFAHGHLFRDEVRRQYATFLARLARDAARRAGAHLAWGLGADLEGPLGQGLGLALDWPLLRERARDELLDWADRQLARHTPARFLDELQGLADGAGLDVAVVRRFHAVAEVASAGCSNLAAWGRATRDGRFYQYRNLDWTLDLGVQDHPLVLEHRPAGDLSGHLTLGFAGFAGALQGVSAAGLTLGEVGAGSRRFSYDGLPMVFRLRRILEEAPDLEAAARVMDEGARTKGYNFVIGSLRERRALAFEQNRERTARFGADDPRERANPFAFTFADVVLRGDFATDPAVRVAQHACDGPGDPRESYSYKHRYRLLADGVAKAHGALDRASLETIARESGNRSRNLLSVIYREDGLAVAYAEGRTRASARPYAELAWGDTATLGALAGTAGAGR